MDSKFTRPAPPVARHQQQSSRGGNGHNQAPRGGVSERQFLHDVRGHLAKAPPHPQLMRAIDKINSRLQSG